MTIVGRLAQLIHDRPKHTVLGREQTGLTDINFSIMKLESITLYHLSMPLVAPFETSFGVTTGRECILVSIQSEGLTGWGECAVDRDPGYSL